MLHRASGLGDAVAWLSIAVTVALVYSVSAVGISVAYVLGRNDRTTSSELLARRLAHLAIASPSLFVLIGVVFFLLHSNGESVFWWGLWVSALFATAWAAVRGRSETRVSSTPNPIPLRIAHGTSALLIVLIFLAWHLLNHASAAFNPEFNQAMMLTLRKWYRSEFVQPVLVTLVLFQVISGAILWWRATAGPGDLYRTLQTSTGAFLMAFIVSHLNAVFILGRTVMKVDTTLPVGLRSSGWSSARRVERAAHSSLLSRRLVPHQSHGTRSPWCAAGSRGVAACRRSCRMDCKRDWGSVRADDHRCTTPSPWRFIAP